MIDCKKTSISNDKNASSSTNFEKCEKKNLILVTIDCLRYDVFVNLLKKGNLPNLAHIAKKGVLFTNAYAPSSWTPPSISSFFSSTYPLMYEGFLNFSPRTPFPEILKSHGYLTISCQTNAWLSRYFNFNKGFHVFLDDFSGAYMKERKRLHFSFPVKNKLRSSSFHKLMGLLYHVYLKFLKRRENPYLTAMELNRKVITLLNSICRMKKNSPIFLWIHYMDAHEPFNPANDNLWYRIITYNILQKIEKNLKIQKEEIDFLKKRYLEAIINIDRAIGDLLEKLAAMNIDFSNTYFIVTSDHGQEFFEHGMFGHSMHLYEELIHVPLIIAGPEIKSRVIIYPTNLIDIPPTILSLLGITKKPLNYKGMDLSGLLLSSRKQFPERVIISEDGIKRRFNAWTHSSRIIKLNIRYRRIACIYNKWKYILNPDGSEELYNLSKDPTEQKNIANDENDIKRFFHQIISAHIDMEKRTSWLQKIYLKIRKIRKTTS